MSNQQLLFSLKSALIFTCLLSAIQGCAGEAVNNNAVPASDVSTKTDATQTVFKVVTKGAPAYFINDQQNPELTLKRGLTYTFELKTTGHPFWIKTKNSTGKANAYAAGVKGNGTERGTLTFAVPKDAPATLHYNCEVHDMMNNVIHIVD
jgi:hypothetical protein